jgi:hypothetical protein
LETITLEVRDFWIELNNVSEGVLLQKVDGAVVYYLYSDTVPTKKRDGFVLNKTDTPVSLFGGKIWVKSEGYTKVSYLAAKVDRPGLSDDIGDLSNLPTTNKDSLVDAIIELEGRIIDTEAGAFTSYYYIISAADIANKQLTLQHLPVRETVIIQPHMGIAQFLDIDFTVTGNIVNWDTLALELLLTEGQRLFISYTIG